MGRTFSMPDYYQYQGKLAEKYDIADFHAGCHITHYPHSDLCAICRRRDKCEEIYNEERNSYMYIFRTTMAKMENK